MILNYDFSKEDFSRFKSCKYKRFECFFQGVIFLRGEKAGEKSIVKVLDEYYRTGSIPFIKICGAYLMIIFDKEKQEYICFADNSVLRSFYIGKTIISDSFIDIIREERKITFNSERICEFISLGYIPFEKTLVNEVKLSNREKYYIVRKGNLITKNKDIGKISDASEIEDVELFFDDVSYALEDMKVSFDITGGFDSRMVVCEMIHNFPNADLLISGPESNPDIVIGKKVAAALDKVIDYYKPNVTEYDENILQELIDYVQASEGFINMYRSWKLAKYRNNKDVIIRITGDGGVLHKDWFWIQDFPFYNRRVKNQESFLSRYYNQRAKIINQDLTFYNEEIIRHLSEQKSKFINNCKQYCKNTNTETYDMLSYYVSATHHYVRYNIEACYVNDYAPLMEYDLVRYAYHLPRYKRFYNNYMRDCTERRNKKVAKIRTIYGTRSTAGMVSKILDIPFYIKNMASRGTLLLMRRIKNRNRNPGIEEWNPLDLIRESKMLGQAIDYCQQIGVLKNNASREILDANTIEVVLTLYNLARNRGRNILVSE